MNPEQQVKKAPATPLPWHSKVIGVGGDPSVPVAAVKPNVIEIAIADDAAYIAHAANAYPKLVEEVKALRLALEEVRRFTIGDAAFTYGREQERAYVDRINGCETAARNALHGPNILRELGEA